MNRKKNFFLSSLLVGFFFLLLQWLGLREETKLFFLSGTLLSLLLILVVYFLFWSQLYSLRDVLTVAVLPSLLILSAAWFSPLLPNLSQWRLLAAGAVALVCYFVLLTENVFVVSYKFKTVPLYRTAFATSFALTLLAGFLILSAIFSFKLSPWTNGLLTVLISFLLFYHLFWSVAITEIEAKDFLYYALTASLLTGELGLAISFLPLSSSLAALYLVSWLYVLGGIFQIKLKGRLFARNLKEYILIGVITLVGLMISAG